MSDSKYEYKIEKIGNGRTRYALHTPQGLRWFNTRKAAMEIKNSLEHNDAEPTSPVPHDSDL